MSNSWQVGQTVQVNYIRWREDKTTTARITKVYKNGNVDVSGWGKYHKDGYGLGNASFWSINGIKDIKGGE